MSIETFSINWPLFIFSSIIICLRTYATSIGLWILNKYYFSSNLIDKLTEELKCITLELANISQQNQFAAYARKQRQYNLLIQRLKDEKNMIELKQKNLTNSIRLIINIGIILIMILLTITGRKHQSKPLFNFSFFHFPFIIWIMALNTFITTLIDIYLRYKINKNSKDIKNEELNM